MPHELDLLSSTPNATFDFDDIPSDFAPSPSPSDSSTSSANTLDAKLELLAAAIPQREGVMGSINSTNHNGSDEHAPRSTSLCLDLSQAVGPAGDDGADKVHGLAYSPTFLDNLPVLHPPVSSYASPDASPPSSPTAAPAHPRTSTTKPDAPQPIRALSAAQFADMHARYLTTHAPDSALFPFLHGLEGDNDAQNAFFVGTAPGAPAEGAAATSVRVSMTARVPRFRGLVWVASDEDDVEEYERSVRAQRARTRSASASSTTAAPAHAPGHGAPAAAPHSSDEEDFLDDESLDGSLDGEDDDYSTSSVEEDDGEAFAALPAARPDLPMDIDVDVVGMDVDDEGLDGMRRAVDLAQHGEGAHMHPVQGRGARRAAARPALSAIDTAGVGKGECLFSEVSSFGFGSFRFVLSWSCPRFLVLCHTTPPVESSAYTHLPRRTTPPPPITPQRQRHPNNPPCTQAPGRRPGNATLRRRSGTRAAAGGPRLLFGRTLCGGRGASGLGGRALWLRCALACARRLAAVACAMSFAARRGGLAGGAEMEVA